MLKFALGNINNLTRSLDAAVRNGWPDHIQGETAERKKMVEEARGEFKSVREELKPLRNDLFMKLAACAALPTSDVPLLRAATECLRLWVEFLDRRIADVAYASMIAENKAYLDCILHLFRFMETLGLVQKPSKGHVALIIFDVATLSKAVVLLHTDLAFRRERIKAGILDPVELAKTNDRVSAFDHLVGFLKSILTIQGTGPSN